MTFDVYTPTRAFRIEDTVIFRTYTRRQMLKLLQKVEGMEIVAVHDFAYDAELPLEIDDSTEDIVFVLRKK